MIWLFACAEPEDSGAPLLVQDEPDPVTVSVEPPSLDFGDVAYGESSAQTLVLTNEGAHAIRFTAVGSGSEELLVEASLGVAIAPGATADVAVTWTPITSAALDETTVNLFVEDLTGQATSVQVPTAGAVSVPVVELGAASLDLGSVGVGCSATGSILVSNVGTSPLDITGISVGDATNYTVTEAGAAPVLPWTLAAGEARTLDVTFAPTSDATIAGVLQITSSDPVTPTAQASLSGTGVVDHSYELTFDVHEKNVTTLFALNAVAVMERSWDDAIPQFFATLQDSRAEWRVALLTENSGIVVGDVPYIDNTMSESEILDAVDGMLANAGGDNDYLLDTFSTGMAQNQDWLVDDSDAWADSTLNLIAMNSDVEQSTGALTTYIATYQSYKNDPSDVKIHAISGPQPRGCDENGLFAEPSGALEYAASSTGGTFISWCEDWETSMATLADAALSGVQRFELTDTPAEWSIEVDIDGRPLTEGWTYDADTNRISFDDEHWPSEGSQVTVRYLVEAECG